MLCTGAVLTALTLSYWRRHPGTPGFLKLEVRVGNGSLFSKLSIKTTVSN